MDIFRTLKGSFQHAQQDLSTSWKSLRSKEKQTRVRQNSIYAGIDVDAGADLLYKYQCYWEEIHQNTEQCASQAQIVDKETTRLITTTENYAKVCFNLHEEVKELPNITNSLQDITSKIAIIGSLLEDTECVLLKLEDVIENQELEKQKATEKHKLALYKIAKAKELDKAKVQCANEHAKRMKEFELLKEAELMERQQAFETAFKEDMKRFKELGKLERTPSIGSSGAPEELLASIEIGENVDELEDFLGPEDDDKQIGNESGEKEEAASEEGEDSTEVQPQPTPEGEDLPEVQTQPTPVNEESLN